MNTHVLPRPGAPRFVGTLRHFGAQLLARERRLTLYAALLLALIVPMALAAGFDERTLRGVDVWVKPIKFASSIALLALTTAWFIGHLRAGRRDSRAVDRIVWLLIGAGTFELAYITLQAALGQGSHYNVGDTLHNVMYTLMGLGALTLTATQPMLAWQLRRDADPALPPAYRLAVQRCRPVAAGARLVAARGRPAAGALHRHPCRAGAAAGRGRPRCARPHALAARRAAADGAVRGAVRGGARLGARRAGVKPGPATRSPGSFLEALFGRF